MRASLEERVRARTQHTHTRAHIQQTLQKHTDTQFSRPSPTHTHTHMHHHHTHACTTHLAVGVGCAVKEGKGEKGTREEVHEEKTIGHRTTQICQNEEKAPFEPHRQVAPMFPIFTTCRLSLFAQPNKTKNQPLLPLFPPTTPH